VKLVSVDVKVTVPSPRYVPDPSSGIEAVVTEMSADVELVMSFSALKPSRAVSGGNFQIEGRG